MTFLKRLWQPGRAGGTLIRSVDLNRMEQGIEDAHGIEAWRTVGAAGQPPFENGWGNYGDVYRAAAFRKTVSGIVFLRGIITAGTWGGFGAFTLPVGYRPDSFVEQNYGTLVLQVRPNGLVCPYGSGAYIKIDFISFTADQ